MAASSPPAVKNPPRPLPEDVAMLICGEEIIARTVEPMIEHADEAPTPLIAEKLREAEIHLDAVRSAHRRGEQAPRESLIVLTTIVAWNTDSRVLGGVWQWRTLTERSALWQVLDTLRDFVVLAYSARRAAFRWAPGIVRAIPLDEDDSPDADEIAEDIAETIELLVRSPRTPPPGWFPLIVDAPRLGGMLALAHAWWGGDIEANREREAAAAIAAFLETYAAELRSSGAPEREQTPVGVVRTIRGDLEGREGRLKSLAVGVLLEHAALALEKRVTVGGIIPRSAREPNTAGGISRAVHALCLAVATWDDLDDPPRPDDEIRARTGVPWTLIRGSVDQYLRKFIRAGDPANSDTRRRVALRLGVYVGLMLQALPPYAA
jgi:hypothetical protein